MSNVKTGERFKVYYDTTVLPKESAWQRFIWFRKARRILKRLPTSGDR